MTDDPKFPEPPTDRCYWAAPGLLGGAYPGDPYGDDAASTKLRALADAGVTLWLDLTHPADPLDPYEEVLLSFGDEKLRRLYIPVADMSVAPREVIEQALEAIDEEIDAGGTVYVHCWGGKGRTGTILGCYLARTLGGEEALEVLNRRRDAQVRHANDVGVRVPETKAQREVIRRWASAPEPGRD